jgi:ABC-2 type transport system permease protein
MNGVSAIVAKGDLIRKISIPRYLTVVSTSVSALINFALNFLVLIGIMLVTGVDVQAKYLLLVPLLLIELYVFSLSVAFILAAAYVKYRDVSFIWEVFTQMLFYLTPIIYPVNLVLDRYPIGKYILLNPVAQIIQQLRYILVTPQSKTTWQVLGWTGLISVLCVPVIGLLAVKYFRSESKTFAENV